jgi:hypothetical protein
VNELKAVSEKRGFPTSSKLSMVTQAELQDDFALMGVRSSLHGKKLELKTKAMNRLLTNQARSYCLNK